MGRPRLPCRCVFMRMATICVLVFTLGSKITSCDGGPCELCGYNQKLYPVSLTVKEHSCQDHGLASQLLCSLALAVEWVWLHRRQRSGVGKLRPVLC